MVRPSRERLLLVVIFVLPFLFTGCMMVSKDYYFSPTAENGESRRQGFEGLVPINGPDDHLIIEHQNIQLTLSADLGYMEVLYGPCIFPIFPIFPLSYFANLANRPHKEFYIDLNLLSTTEKVELEFEKFILSIRGRGEISPNKVETFYPDMKTIPISNKVPINRLRESYIKEGFKYYDLYHVYYDVSPFDLNSFDLNINGIYVDGKLVSFPVVKFKKGCGWSWGA